MKRSILILFILIAFVSCEKETIQSASPPSNYLKPYTGTYNGTAEIGHYEAGIDTSYPTGVNVIVTLGQKDSTVSLQINYGNGENETHSDLEMDGFRHESWYGDEKLEFEFPNDSTFVSSWILAPSLAYYYYKNIMAEK